MHRAVADTGWLIAAEKNQRSAIAHLKALTLNSQVLTISAGVIVEAMRRSIHLTTVQFFVSRLEAEETTTRDGLRASEMLRAAGRYTGTPHVTVHQISVVDALVAAIAERLSGSVYTADPKDMQLLARAGARINPVKVHF